MACARTKRREYACGTRVVRSWRVHHHHFDYHYYYYYYHYYYLSCRVRLLPGKAAKLPHLSSGLPRGRALLPALPAAHDQGDGCAAWVLWPAVRGAPAAVASCSSPMPSAQVVPLPQAPGARGCHPRHGAHAFLQQCNCNHCNQQPAPCCPISNAVQRAVRCIQPYTLLSFHVQIALHTLLFPCANCLAHTCFLPWTLSFARTCVPSAPSSTW